MAHKSKSPLIAVAIIALATPVLADVPVGSNTTRVGARLVLESIDIHDPAAPEKVRRACETTGAFHLSGHSLTEERLTGIRSIVSEFFDLPVDEKRKTPRLDNDGDPRGYSGYEEENVYALSGTDGPPDPIEKFSIGGAGNVWPTRPAAMEAQLQALFEDTTALARRIFVLLAQALGLPDKHHFAPLISRSRDSMRFLNYPAYTEEKRRSGQLRMAPHTDMGVFSLLFPTAAPGGLEYLKQGTWRPVATEARGQFKR